MNKKITVKNYLGILQYCVLDGNKDFEQQLNEWYFHGDTKDYGVNFSEQKIAVIDYHAWEERGSFPIVSIEDTDMEVALEWIEEPGQEKRTVSTSWDYSKSRNPFE